MTSYNELREWLETELEYGISDRQWTNAVRDLGRAIGDYTADLEDGVDPDTAAESFSQTFRGWWAKGRGRKQQESVEITAEPDPRWQALAEILAIRARRDRDVQWFRTEILDGTLVEPDRIVEWFDTTVDSDGPSTKFVTIPVRDDGTWPTDRDEARQIAGRWSQSYEQIRFASGDYSTTGVKAIRSGGTLDRLRRVARRLAVDVFWPEAWMTTFVLTDVTPPAPIPGQVQLVEGRDVPTLSTISMTVNPYAIAPRELENEYRDFRMMMIRSERVRQLSEKMAALAVFVEATPGMLWVDRQQRWNRQHPEWRYETNFSRDARQAYENVTGQKWSEQ